jgi:hypothetical protein
VELDGQLRQAIFNCLPEGASFGFNWIHDRSWIQLLGPGDATTILNTALERLGRPLS